MTVFLAHCLTRSRRGCRSGSDASRRAALKHHFSMVDSNGRRFASALRESVGDVRRPPVIASAPALCVLVSFLAIVTVPSRLFPASGFLADGGVYHTSAP